MKRSAVKGHHNKYADNPLFVVTHAKAQRGRGKGPSLPYGKYLNPRKALEAATRDLLAKLPSMTAKMALEGRILKMHQVAFLIGREIAFKTANDWLLIVGPTGSTNFSRVVFSKDYADKEAERAFIGEFAVLLQIVRRDADCMMCMLKELDPTNRSAHIDWLVAFQKLTQEFLPVSAWLSACIRAEFARHGYTAINEQQQLDPSVDTLGKEAKGTWVIGLALGSLIYAGSITPFLELIAKRWNEMPEDQVGDSSAE